MRRRASLPLRSGIPMRALIPNAITMLALCAGATGVRFAVAGQFDKAAAAIVVAGILDGIDGRVARLLRGTSRFGAELDSLSDVTAFGIAPALIIYLWALEHIGGIGWVVALSHAVCCALRLARFNAQIDETDLPMKRAGFLTGVPAPVGAGLTLSPLFLALAWEAGPLATDLEIRGVVAAVVTATTAFLMVSSLPTWSWTSARVPRASRILVLAVVGLFAAALAQEPWGTLTAISVAYAISVPFAWRRYAAVRRRAAAAGGALATEQPRHESSPSEPPAG